MLSQLFRLDSDYRLLLVDLLALNVKTHQKRSRSPLAQGVPLLVELWRKIGSTGVAQTHSGTFGFWGCC